MSKGEPEYEIEKLKLMFPDIDESVIKEILEVNQKDVEKAIDNLLYLSDPNPFSIHSLDEEASSTSYEQMDEALARMLQDEQFAQEINRHEDLRTEIYGSKRTDRFDIDRFMAHTKLILRWDNELGNLR
jgi:hypothetical protein